MMIDNIANEIILASVELKTNNISTIASELGYQPLLIMNALFAGEKAGKFVYVKKKDIIKISKDVEPKLLAITEGLADSREQIETFMTYENALGVDMTLEELRGFIPMLPELHLKLAISSSKVLDTYKLADPKDKESVYTFVTLKDNIDKKFGKRQFEKK